MPMPTIRVNMAEGGPPEIDWQTAAVVKNEALCRGTNVITLQAETPVAYLPGHILGFEIAHPETGEGLKGPYTVSRSTSETTFDIIYRVIPDGRKTPFMAELQPGAAVRFGGRFGTPVEEGISPECDRVIGVATGAGLGPLVGYAERALAAADGPERVDIFCGFRDLQDVCGGAAVEALKQQYPDRFSFMPCISKPMACTAVGLAGLSSSPSSAFSGMSSPPPPPAPGFAQGRVSTAVPGMLADLNDRTHFHLIGNGQFVVDFQAGLLAGGVAEERVTTEKYFNGKATPDETVVDYVAGAISARLPQAA